MNKLTIAALLLFSSSASATITLSWIPGDVVEGAMVTEWIIKCGPQADPYSNPIRLPFLVREYKMENLPNGMYKCKARAYSNESGNESEDSEVVEFEARDGKKYTGTDPIPYAIPLPPVINNPNNL